MGVLVDVLYLINIPRLLTPRRRAPIANYLFICVTFVTTLFLTLIYFSGMFWENIVFIMIFVLLFLIVFYNIAKNKSDLEDEAIDFSVVTTERDIAEIETKISDLERKQSSASGVEKLSLRREIANLRQQNAVRRLDEERVFDTSLVQEIRTELTSGDQEDLKRLGKKETELQDRIEELERNPEKDRDVNVSNEISALMAKQKNIQDIKNRKIGYASEKDKNVNKALGQLDTQIKGYEGSLTTLQTDKKEIEKKLKTSKGEEKKRYKNQLDSVESAIGTRKEEIELEKRKRKVLEDGRIDNLRGIEVYNKGANTVRAEAVANDGLIRLIEKNRLKRKATKADREVLLRAQNRVDAREMQQETLDLGLAYASGRDTADDTANGNWTKLQEENFKRLTTAQEARLEEELEKQEAVDLAEDRIAIEKFEKIKDKNLLGDAAEFGKKYSLTVPAVGAGAGAGAGDVNYDNLKTTLQQKLRGENVNPEERRLQVEQAINDLFDESKINQADVDNEVGNIMGSKDAAEADSIKALLSDAYRTAVITYLDGRVGDLPVGATITDAEKKKLRQYKLNRASVKAAEETIITDKIKEKINKAKQDLLKSFDTVEQKRDSLIQNNEELVKVRTRLDKIRRDTVSGTGELYSDLGIDSTQDKTAAEVYSQANYDVLFDRTRKKKITQDLAKDVQDDSNFTNYIIDEIKDKNNDDSTGLGFGDDISKRLRYNAVKRSLNRIENDAIGVANQSDLRGKVAQIKAPVVRPALAGVGLAAGAFGLPAAGAAGAFSIPTGVAAAAAAAATKKEIEANSLIELQSRANKPGATDNDKRKYISRVGFLVDATLQSLNDF